jgi:general secretion pathway protein L
VALTGQQWNLFGYDLRTLPALWLSAWREVLWSEEAPVRRWLDEPVRVFDSNSGLNLTDPGRIVGSKANGASRVVAVARLLPDDMVLSCWLNLPEKAEGHLLSAIELEVRSRSPFPADDTVSGWRIAGREGGILRISLCIASHSAVNAWLHGFLTAEDAEKVEIWADVGGHPVVLQGFAEGLRNQRYSARLKRLGLWGVCIFALSLVLIAVPVGLRAIQLDHYENELVHAQQASAQAVRYRASLATDNERINDVNRQFALANNPHRELVRLTALLDDTVYLNSYEQTTARIRIDGMAVNAAKLMSVLSDTDWYADVKAPSAIRREGRIEMERFVLDLTLAPEVSP